MTTTTAVACVYCVFCEMDVATHEGVVRGRYAIKHKHYREKHPFTIDGVVCSWRYAVRLYTMQQTRVGLQKLPMQVASFFYHGNTITAHDVLIGSGEIDIVRYLLRTPMVYLELISTFGRRKEGRGRLELTYQIAAAAAANAGTGIIGSDGSERYHFKKLSPFFTLASECAAWIESNDELK